MVEDDLFALIINLDTAFIRVLIQMMWINSNGGNVLFTEDM